VGPHHGTYLLIIGDREALAWILREGRTAFPPGRERSAKELRVGDRLLVYTTRGCFRNPTRDRGRVLGVAVVMSEVEDLEEPVLLAEREFTTGCTLQIEALAPLHQGVELAPLVSRLKVFPDAASWSAVMRRPLLSLPAADRRLLERELRPRLRPVREAIDAYIDAARLTDARARS
jgi:hypothetical protein